MAQVSKINMGGIDYDIRDKVLEKEVANIKPIVNQGTINNAADEEDLTSENNLLKLKDRSELNGMGYVILRKNKTFAEQVKKANTIYEIRYDFDLRGATLELEDNIVLRFDGGIIRNGVINANVLTIDASDVKIFDNIQFRGNCIYNTFHLDWFVANRNTSLIFENPSNSTYEVQAAFNSGVRNMFLDNRYFYYISDTIVVPHYVAIDGIKQATGRSRFLPYNTPSFYTDKEISVFRIVASRGEDGTGYSHKVHINNLYVFVNSPFTESEPKENIAALEIVVHDAHIWGGEINPYLYCADRKFETSSDNPKEIYLCGYTGVRVVVDNKQYFTMLSFGGTIDYFYKAFDLQIADDSWCTSITYNTETSCVYGGNLAGGPIRITGNHQSLVCIKEDEPHQQYFTCRGEVEMRGIVWDMGQRNGEYTSASPAIVGDGYVTDLYNKDSANGNNVPLPVNYGNRRIAGEMMQRFYDNNSDVLPLIFHKIINTQYGNNSNAFSPTILNSIGELQEAKLMTSDGSESVELSEAVDNWEYLTAPIYTPRLSVIANAYQNAVYATPCIKKGIDAKYNRMSIVWKLNASGVALVNKGFFKAQVLFDTTIVIEKYGHDGALKSTDTYEYSPSGDVYQTDQLAVKSLLLLTDNYNSCIIRCEYRNIRRDIQAIVPKFSIICNSNLNNVTINGGVVANPLKLGNVEYYDAKMENTLRRKEWESVYGKRREITSGYNTALTAHLVSFVKTTSATYPVTIHCTLDSHFYGHRSSILESFTICVADTEKVICNSKYVRAIAKKSGNNYSIYVTRIDYPLKRNNSNSNNVTINYIESESPIKIQGFDDSDAIEMNSINSCGTTAQRPTLQSYDNNFEYYDSNLEEVIHWDGTHWLNSNKVVAGTPTSGMFYYKPTTSANLIPIGFKYFCTDKKTAEGSENGIEIIHKGNDVWVDALGRVIS